MKVKTLTTSSIIFVDSKGAPRGTIGFAGGDDRWLALDLFNKSGPSMTISVDNEGGASIRMGAIRGVRGITLGVHQENGAALGFHDADGALAFWVGLSPSNAPTIRYFRGNNVVDILKVIQVQVKRAKRKPTAVKSKRKATKAARKPASAKSGKSNKGGGGKRSRTA